MKRLLQAAGPDLSVLSLLFLTLSPPPTKKKYITFLYLPCVQGTLSCTHGDSSVLFYPHNKPERHGELRGQLPQPHSMNVVTKWEFEPKFPTFKSGSHRDTMLAVQ